MFYLRWQGGMEQRMDFRINTDLRSNAPMSENGQLNGQLKSLSLKKG